jgi:serine/threonine-protein kinase
VYRVVRHLATGGMGSVYEVEDTTVEKRYVLKTLHPNLVSREDLTVRMRDEARSLARLSHPNIVEVFTAGVTTDAVPLPFYVMERLVGQNLRVALDKTGVLQPAHAYRIAIDVADALEHAHERSLVHRDVKPENIFLHRHPNGTTTTKLLDFGIVRLLDRKESRTHGKFIGTLRYASPEQIVGERLGPSSDLYSLGVVLFEMLCGRGPFDDAGDAYAVGAAHAKVPAPPLSRFAPGVAPGAARLVASALAKSPAERPRDALAFASELRRLLHEEEATPRSATVVDLLTSGAPATDAAPTATLAMAPGMPPPSTTEIAGTELEAVEGGPVSPIAPTVAAGAAHVPTQVAAYVRAIDRDAPTRASARPLGRPGAAPNGTEAVESLSGEGLAPEAAPAPPAPPPAPPAAPAHTRPPERGPYLLVGVATVLAIAMVGGALLAVRRPPQGSAADAGASAAAPVRPSHPPLVAPVTMPAATTSDAAPAAPAEPVSAPVVPSPRAAPSAAPRGAAKPRPSASAPARAKDVPFDP